MRVNWLAIAVSAIVFFILAFFWYDVFFQSQWQLAMSRIDGGSRNEEPLAYLFVLTLAMPFLLTYGLAQILAWRGPTKPFRAAFIGFSMGVLIFGSMTWLVYTHSGWGAELASINIGYVVLGMMITGLILGAWRTAEPSRPNTDRRQGIKFLLAFGVAGPLLNVLVVFIVGAVRPSYSALRVPDSALELGPGGWMQIANYLITGALVLGFAAGLRLVLRTGRGSTWGPILVGLYGLSFLGAGIFVTDPAAGYPPGAVTESTFHGIVHNLLGLLQFASVIAACFVLSRRAAAPASRSVWFSYSLATGVVVAISYVVFIVIFRIGGPAGLIERIGIVAACAWMAILAIRVWRTIEIGGCRLRERS